MSVSPKFPHHAAFARAVKLNHRAVKDADHSSVNLMRGNWTRRSVDSHRLWETKLGTQKGKTLVHLQGRARCFETAVVRDTSPVLPTEQ